MMFRAFQPVVLMFLSSAMGSEVYTAIWHGLYIVIMIPTVIGNGLILISVLRFKRLQSTMHILIGNLAISDFIVGAILIPYSLLTDGDVINNHMYLCFGKLSLFVICLGTSCYNLMLISIERFVSITRPLHAKHFFTVCKLSIMIGFGWALSLANAIVPFFGWNTYGLNNTACISDTLWHPAYKIMMNWEMIFALFTNFIMYTVVVRIVLYKAYLRSHVHAGLSVHAKMDTDVYQVVTMVIVLGMFALCWFPYVCAAVVVTFYETPSTQHIRRYTLVPGLFNSAINWIIYGCRNQDFRIAFKYIMTLKCLPNRKRTRRPHVYMITSSHRTRV